jgi:hypothetical protein
MQLLWGDRVVMPVYGVLTGEGMRPIDILCLHPRGLVPTLLTALSHDFREAAIAALGVPVFKSDVAW